MAAAEEHGKVTIIAYDQQDRPIATIYEGRTNRLSASTTPSEQVAMAMKPVRIFEDCKIKCFFTSDAADTVEKAESIMRLDITIFDVRSGKIVGPGYESTLTEADLMCNDAGSGIVCAAGVPVELGYKTVPAGACYVVGQGPDLGMNGTRGRFYSLIKDDTA